MADYIKPTCNLSASIKTVADETGTSNLIIKGKFTESIVHLPLNNNLTVEYRYKVENGEYTSWNAINAENTIVDTIDDTYSATVEVTGLDYTKKHTFQARVTDICSTVESKAKTVKAIPIFDWGENDFNFNVPVNFNDPANFDTIVTAGGYNLAGLAKAMSNSYNLNAEVTQTNTNYSASSVSAVLVGNELRIGFSATRSTATGTGNIENETICSVKITHNGKITQAFDVSFASGGTGAVSTFNAASVSVADIYLTFNIQLNATTIAAKNFGSYFTIPVVLNLDAY